MRNGNVHPSVDSKGCFRDLLTLKICYWICFYNLLLIITISFFSFLFPQLISELLAGFLQLVPSKAMLSWYPSIVFSTTFTTRPVAGTSTNGIAQPHRPAETAAWGSRALPCSCPAASTSSPAWSSCAALSSRKKVWKNTNESFCFLSNHQLFVFFYFLFVLFAQLSLSILNTSWDWSPAHFTFPTLSTNPFLFTWQSGRTTTGILMTGISGHA